MAQQQMSDPDNNLTLLVSAEVNLLSNDQTGWSAFEGLKTGSRPSVFLENVQYATVLHSCRHLIRPGASGEAEFLFASNAILSARLEAGDELEIGRAHIRAGTMKIKSIQQVRVERSPAPERGYAINSEDE